AVTTPSNTWRQGTNFPSFFPQISSTKEVPQRTAQRYQIAAQRQSAVTFKAALPVTPSMVPKTTAFTATKVENQAKGMGLKFHSLENATKIYVKPKSSPVPAA